MAPPNGPMNKSETIAASRLPRSLMNQVRRVAGVLAVGPIAVSNGAIDFPLESPARD